MSDDDAADFPPALTAQQWKRGLFPSEPIIYNSPARRAVSFGILGEWPNALAISIEGHVARIEDPSDLAALIALANHAMNDEDPRKIRRETIQVIREAAELVAEEAPDGPGREPTGERGAAVVEGGGRRSQMKQLASALESYLPEKAERDT